MSPAARISESCLTRKTNDCFRPYWRTKSYNDAVAKASRRFYFTTALVVLFCTALAPSPSLGVTIGTITAGGYTFVNFDPPLVGNAVGSNVNGISNTGQVVGTQVDMINAPTFTNFTGTAAVTTQLNTGSGQIAFGINSAGDVVGGNGAAAFFLPNGGSLQCLATPSGAINAFGINDKGNI